VDATRAYLDEIAPGGEPNPPSEMITSVVEAIYDDYAKVNFRITNSAGKTSTSSQHSLANSKTYTNFSRSWLDQQRRRGSRAGSDKRERSGQSLQRASGKGLEFHTVFVIWLTDGMFPSSRSLDTRDAWRKSAACFTWRSRARAMSFISPIPTCV
jgi:DNA helicase-2/ATP-dependent DNA helicase PcrA